MSPVVPTYQRQVGTEALPGARLSPNAPAGAFGAVDYSGVSQVATQAGALIEREIQHADQVAVLDAHVKLTNLRNTLLYDPQYGVLNQRGINAMGAASKATEAWRKGAADIEGSLASDRQKESFQKIAAGAWADVSADVERHVYRESNAHDQETTAAGLELAYGDVVRHAGDPVRVADAIEQGKIIAEGFAHRQGYDAVQTKDMISSLVSRAHFGVMESLSNSQQDLAATIYFAKHRDEFSGEELVKAERLVEAGSLRGESQRQADTIAAKAASLQDGLSAARTIQDPRVRDDVEQRVRRHFEDIAADQRDKQADAFHKASKILEDTGDFHKIPLSLREKMSPEENGALQHREDQIRHPKQETRLDTYNSLMNLAGLSEASRKQFESLNLLDYRKQLSDEDFHSLVREQLSLRLGTMNPELSAERKARQKAADWEANVDRLSKMPGMTQEGIAAVRALGPQATPRVPGGPMYAPASAAPMPPTDSALAAPKKRGSVQRNVRPDYIEAAKRDPVYRDYLEHHGVAVPDSTASVPSGNTEPRGSAPSATSAPYESQTSAALANAIDVVRETTGYGQLTTDMQSKLADALNRREQQVPGTKRMVYELMDSPSMQHHPLRAYLRELTKGS